MFSCVERYNLLKYGGDKGTSNRSTPARKNVPVMPGGGGSLDNVPGWD